MILTDLFSMVLRLAELAFAAIVAGLTGNYLHAVRNTSSSWDQGRFIYTEVVAGLSILLSIIWLFPFAGSFIHWPTDVIISICWFVSFGLMVNWLNGTCGYIFDWAGISFDGTDTCAEWKAIIAFAFLSAICWFVSALVGIYWVNRQLGPAGSRRRWYRTYRV
jgi:hypothetical protein